MEKKNDVREQFTVLDKPRYVIHDGIRMTYEEWREMKESERN